MFLGKLTRAEHAQHIIENRGYCGRIGKYCNPNDCGIMADYGTCLPGKKRLLWADGVIAGSSGNEKCISIW